jgi:prevent-host-death family protein
MSTVTIQQAKANLSELIPKVAAGEEVITARGANPWPGRFRSVK